MNLQVSGHHLEITPALHDYVTGKLERITRHFDNVIDVNVILSVDKLSRRPKLPFISLARMYTWSLSTRTCTQRWMAW